VCHFLRLRNTSMLFSSAATVAILVFFFPTYGTLLAAVTFDQTTKTASARHHPD